ncbi:hypothetical protein [Dorea formicigenerans]|uniref:hypothetical protein n=1 Tax=Dorea formicigenerans TaxID=39486 RepID=UPI001FA889DA|nr:hypothetical protein [Dorea formicigenerans]
MDISKAGNPNSYNRKPLLKKEIATLWKIKDSNVYVTVILICKNVSYARLAMSYTRQYFSC